MLIVLCVCVLRLTFYYCRHYYMNANVCECVHIGAWNLPMKIIFHLVFDNLLLKIIFDLWKGTENCNHFILMDNHSWIAAHNNADAADCQIDCQIALEKKSHWKIKLSQSKAKQNWFWIQQNKLNFYKKYFLQKKIMNSP